MTITQTIGAATATGFWSPQIISAIISGCVALITGGVVSLFAWRQWKTAQDKLVLDLFDRRLANYRVWQRAIRDKAQVIAQMAIDGLDREPSLRSDLRFSEAASDALYLFGTPIHMRITGIVSRLEEIEAHPAPNDPQTEAELKALWDRYAAEWLMLGHLLDEFLLLDKIGKARRQTRGYREDLLGPGVGSEGW